MNCGKKMALYFESSRTLYEPENALELNRTKNSHFKGPKGRSQGQPKVKILKGSLHLNIT